MDEESVKKWEERMVALREKQDAENLVEAEKLRQDYLRRTGRDRMKS